MGARFIQVNGFGFGHCRLDLDIGFGGVRFLSMSGLVPLILLGAILGGGVGFSLPLLVKGLTGQTPQERKEAVRK